ncbi:MAG: sugar ABC transporter substrate-binding protein [Rhodobacteraceae bacterium]|nr:sugar ABC transporter substrate-binding protein [Paracoccaceae bacterium]
MKITRRIALAGLIGTSAILTGLSAHAEAAGKSVAVLLGPTQDAFIGTWLGTFEGAAEAAGMKIQVFSSPYDPALQARQLDDAVAQSFDAIVLQSISQNALVPSLERTKEAGVPVFTVISQPDAAAQGLYVTYIGENSRMLGALAGEAMADAAEARGLDAPKIAAVTGALAEGIGPKRLAGFEEALKARLPGAEMVAIEDVRWNPVDGEQAAGQLIARFSGQGGIDGFYGMNDRLANAVVQAAGTTGVAVGADGMIVVGGNCQAPGIPNLASGAMTATVRMLPVVSAAKAAEVVGAYFNGETLDAAYYEDHEIITQANLADNAEACGY